MANPVKKEFEIKNIKRACHITDMIFNKIIGNFNFRKESDISKLIYSEAKRYKCGIAFKPIVASGKDASKPHYTRNYKILRKGFCVIDLGVRYKGYCSDMTRTIFIGKPSKKDIEMYNLVLNAQERTIKRAKKGAKCSYLEEFCRKELGRYSKKMIHSLGHGVGRKIHQMPKISRKSKDVLMKNMVFTIEPGIYLNNKGIRIEDTLVLKNKPIILTRSEKRLICV